MYLLQACGKWKWSKVAAKTTSNQNLSTLTGASLAHESREFREADPSRLPNSLRNVFVYVTDEPTSSWSASAAKTLYCICVVWFECTSTCSRLMVLYLQLHPSQWCHLTAHRCLWAQARTLNGTWRATCVITTQNPHGEEHESKLLEDYNAFSRG